MRWSRDRAWGSGSDNVSLHSFCDAVTMRAVSLRLCICVGSVLGRFRTRVERTMARLSLRKIMRYTFRVGNDSPMPPRLKVLLAVLVVVCVGAAGSQVRTWQLERELLRIAGDIVREHNAEDNVPAYAAMPAAETICKVYASPKYVLFGAVTGKIVFLITPECSVDHSSKEERILCAICSGAVTYELDYLYLRGDDGWVFQESYMCHPGERHR